MSGDWIDKAKLTHLREQFEQIIPNQQSFLSMELSEIEKKIQESGIQLQKTDIPKIKFIYNQEKKTNLQKPLEEQQLKDSQQNIKVTKPQVNQATIQTSAHYKPSEQDIIKI